MQVATRVRARGGPIGSRLDHAAELGQRVTVADPVQVRGRILPPVAEGDRVTPRRPRSAYGWSRPGLARAAPDSTSTSMVASA